MTLRTKTYAKDGIITSLHYGMGSEPSKPASYFVAIDGVVIAQCSSYRPVWVKGQSAEQALTETGWKAWSA